MKASVTLALAALVAAGPALANPPGHAPAHGYYKKHYDHDHDRKHHKKARHYQGKSGVAYAHDYGISSGRCNRDEIGAVIGGVTGAVIGSQVAGRDDRVVGMVVGGVLGAVLGHAVGDSMDERDRACMGHALELGRPGVPVAWHRDGHDYRFTPRGDARDGCRYATLAVNGRAPHDVLACPSGRGEWHFRRS
ncbi:glycine zipper 2TM domain-containing protein [Thiobacillus denitrificans]|uniref:glycine zipper 2TM domain-containing protein n=1 Tax=Thiobacillus denitrificans TaxID=36861 RepID=UPI0003686672|nr:glycine zipper domain-containing protein [Thiobacillus denitrificans]